MGLVLPFFYFRSGNCFLLRNRFSSALLLLTLLGIVLLAFDIIAALDIVDHCGDYGNAVQGPSASTVLVALQW
jgi:hypothetical protein